MRVRVLVLASQGFGARLGARSRSQKERLRDVIKASGERVFGTAASLTPFDTGFMLDKLRLESTHDGFGYDIGWFAGDFVGQVNQATGQRIEAFYPVFVILGTRFVVGRDPLTPALRREEPTLKRELKRALGG